MNISNMLNSHPSGGKLDPTKLSRCIEDCFGCEQACTACADACLAEDQLQMLRKCIRTDLDCADICATTGRILCRQTETDTGVVRAQLEALQKVVRACAEECEKHSSRHEHCRICAEACRQCEKSCSELVGAIGR